MEKYEVKFLIIRFSSIGDIVLTTPIIRGIKQQVENSVVHYLTKPQFKSLLENNPHIDKLHLLKNYKQTIEELRGENFDYIIDLHNNIRTFRFKNSLKVMDFTFKKLNWEKWLYVNFKINRLPAKSIVDRYYETVSIFDVKNDNLGLDYFHGDENIINLNDYSLIKNNYITFGIGGNHQTKKLPTKKIIEICKNIESPIVLLGGKEDFLDGELIKNDCSNTINLCGKININQSAFIVCQSRVVITHDTGIMHIAAAYKKDIISIWGNTVPEFGMYPYLAGISSKIYEIKGLKCRPCSKIGFKKCPKKHFNCMEKQDSNSIVNYANEVMKKINNHPEL
jgi:ADP-heptose:LPS heptosyltransferase